MRSILLLSLLSAAVLPAQQPTFPLTALRPNAPLICSHRGRLTAAEMEVSVTVMRHTFGQGIVMMEFDTRKSANGTIFLSHDATLDRTTDGTGTVASHTDAQLAKVSVRDPLTGKPVEPIARFDDLLGWAQTVPVALMVDLKDTPPADAVAALRARSLIDHAVFLTFDPKTATAAFASDPKVAVSVLVKTTQEIDAALAEAHGHPLVFYIANTAEPALFAYAHRLGFAIISDALGDLDARAEKLGSSIYRDFLRAHPTDVLVTDRALQLKAALR